MPEDTPRWQQLQEEWNALVPAAQAAGIPRVRLVKIGPESIRYREERLSALKSQLKGQLKGAGLPSETTQMPTAITAPGSSVVRQASPSGLGASASLRHDMPSRNFDITVTFEDDTSEVLLVMARDPLSAIRLASYTPTREWPAERLQSIASITWRIK